LDEACASMLVAAGFDSIPVLRKTKRARGEHARHVYMRHDATYMRAYTHMYEEMRGTH